RSIHLLSFLSERAAPDLLARRQLSPGKRTISALTSSLNDLNMEKTGRIWIHRPFQITPPSSSASPDNPIITHCPLRRPTPRARPEERLHNLFSSSPQPEELLKRIHKSKVDFYQSQFQSRVAQEVWTRIRRHTVESPHGMGEVDVTTYFPDQYDAQTQLRGICLHVHGGGWFWGDSYHQVAHRCLEMAESMKVAVVSVEYSLFCRPNRHYDNPQAFDPVNDVSVAMDWIESSGPNELNALPSFVASGESYGAHLILLAMLCRRDRDKMSPHPPAPLPSANSLATAQSASLTSSPWKCLNLVYGVFDISGTPSICTDGDTSSPICGDDLLWMFDTYHSKVQASMLESEQKNLDRHHPSFSPLYANLSHLPPALLSVGTSDPLLDDSLFLATKYSSYGNHVELAIYEGGEHGIGHFGVQEEEEMGRLARRHTLSFMKDHLKLKS
ncbi:hypothetical protein ACHAWF_006624, partial [Thalassiosira exigua]